MKAFGFGYYLHTGLPKADVFVSALHLKGPITIASKVSVKNSLVVLMKLALIYVGNYLPIVSP